MSSSSRLFTILDEHTPKVEKKIFSSSSSSSSANTSSSSSIPSRGVIIPHNLTTAFKEALETLVKAFPKTLKRKVITQEDELKVLINQLESHWSMHKIMCLIDRGTRVTEVYQLMDKRIDLRFVPSFDTSVEGTHAQYVYSRIQNLLDRFKFEREIRSPKILADSTKLTDQKIKNEIDAMLEIKQRIEKKLYHKQSFAEAIKNEDNFSAKNDPRAMLIIFAYLHLINLKSRSGSYKTWTGSLLGNFSYMASLGAYSAVSSKEDKLPIAYALLNFLLSKAPLEKLDEVIDSKKNIGLLNDGDTKALYDQIKEVAKMQPVLKLRF